MTEQNTAQKVGTLIGSMLGTFTQGASWALGFFLVARWLGVF